MYNRIKLNNVKSYLLMVQQSNSPFSYSHKLHFGYKKVESNIQVLTIHNLRYPGQAHSLQ